MGLCKNVYILTDCFKGVYTYLFFEWSIYYYSHSIYYRMFMVEYPSYETCNIDQYILITDCWKGVYGSFFKLGILLDAKQKK